MMTRDRTPDAVRSPLPFAGAGDSRARLARLHATFAPVLKVPRVFVRHQGAEHFISGSPQDTLNFPRQDPRSGAPRYDWEDRGDGVLLGYLDVRH
jgi:hypothetical protein